MIACLESHVIKIRMSVAGRWVRNDHHPGACFKHVYGVNMREDVVEGELEMRPDWVQHGCDLTSSSDGWKNSSHGSSCLNHTQVAVEHQVEGKHSAKRRWRDLWLCEKKYILGKIITINISLGESGCPSWLRRWARFGIVDDDVRAGDLGSRLASA